MKNNINIYWIDKHKNLIFMDKMNVSEFKKLHGVSPHICDEVYQDVLIRIGDVL